MATPDPVQQAVEQARLDTKVDMLFKIVNGMKADLEELKARRVPWVGASAACSAVAAIAAVVSVAHR